MAAITSVQRKQLSAARKLLSSREWDGVQQGLDLLAQHADPALWGVFAEGLSINEEGDVEIPKGCEVNKRVKTDFRRDVALRALSEVGGLADQTALKLHALFSLGFLSGCASLTHLKLSYLRAMSIDGLAGCPSLTSLEIGSSLKSAAFPALAALESLVIVDTSVRQIEGLGGCSSLAHLTLKCRSLRTLDALEGSSTLETLDLSYCGSLQSLEGLRGCAALTTLRMIDGGAAPLEPLGACTALTDLDVSDSRLRTTLAGLEGHPALQRIRLDKSGVADLDGLAGCAALEEVHGKGAFSLADISGLGDCPSLTKLDFYGSKLPRFLQRTFESVSLLDLRYALSEYADVFASGALQTERLLEVLDQNLGLLCFSGMLSGVSDEKFEVVHELGPHQHMVFGQIFGLDPNDPNQRIERKVDLLSLWSDVCTWHRNFDAEIKQKHPDPKVLVTHHRKALVVGAVLSRLEKGAAYVIGEDSLSMSTNPRHPVYWVGLHDGAVIGVRSVVVWA